MDLQNPADLLLATVPEKGPAPEYRLTTVAEADRVYRRLFDDDLESSRNRAKIDALFDGEPPFDQEELRATGQANRTNINTGGAKSRLEYTVTSYLDLVNSVDRFATVTLKPEAGELADRLYYAQVIEQEYTRMLRTWPGFEFAFQDLVTRFIKHGVAIAAFDDSLDWRWKVSGLGDVKIPRQTSTSVEDIEVACSLRRYQAHQLWDCIRNKEVARNLGWNPEVVQGAIARATSGGRDAWQEHERIQQELKNNDLSVSARSSEIKVVHLWVKEFDGTISHLAYEANNVQTEPSKAKFLLEHRGKYKDPHDLFTFFTYGIGTNGTYHSVRGLGYALYHLEQLSNRARCQMIDQAMLFGVMFKPTSDEALDDLTYTSVGPMTIIPPGLELINNNTPDQNRTMIPVMNDLSAQIDQATGTYINQNLAGGGSREQTRFEVASRMEQLARLNAGAMNLFYVPWERLLRTSLRRATAKGVTRNTPGGALAIRLRERCEERGVPRAIFQYIDHDLTRAVRSVGAGSAAQRTIALERLREYYGQYDEAGRAALLYDITAATVGTDTAERYVTREMEDRRPPIDTKVAILENDHLIMGKQVPVLPTERHLPHLDILLTKQAEILQQAEEGTLPLEDALAPLAAMQDHGMQHLAYVEQDPMLQEQVGQIRAALQRSDEIIGNAQRHVAKLQRQAEEEAAAAPEGQPTEGGPGGLSPEMEQKIQMHRLQLQMMQEKAQVQMSIMMQKAEQQRQLKDAEAAVNFKKFLPTNYPTGA